MSKTMRCVLVIILLMAGCILSSAQVELHSEIVPVEEHELYVVGSSEDLVVVDYLLLTEKDESCVEVDVLQDVDWGSQLFFVCLFDHPETGEPILHMDQGPQIVLLAYHEGDLVGSSASASFASPWTDLAPGDWQVDAYFEGLLKAYVMFSISSAPVEWDSGIEPYEEPELYSVGGIDELTVVNYQRQTAKDEYCVNVDPYHDQDRSYATAEVCLFEHPKIGEPILDMDTHFTRAIYVETMFRILHEGEPVHTTSFSGRILTDLAPGEWQADVYLYGALKAFVTFTIEGEEEEEEDADV